MGVPNLPAMGNAIYPNTGVQLIGTCKISCDTGRCDTFCGCRVFSGVHWLMALFNTGSMSSNFAYLHDNILQKTFTIVDTRDLISDLHDCQKVNNDHPLLIRTLVNQALGDVLNSVEVGHYHKFDLYNYHCNINKGHWSWSAWKVPLSYCSRTTLYLIS